MQKVKEIDKRLDSNINFRVVKYCHEIMSRVRGWTYNARIGKYCTSNAFIYNLIMRKLHVNQRRAKTLTCIAYTRVHTISYNRKSIVTKHLFHRVIVTLEWAYLHIATEVRFRIPKWKLDDSTIAQMWFSSKVWQVSIGQKASK